SWYPTAHPLSHITPSSVPFRSVPFSSVPFLSVPFPSVPFPSVPYPSVPFPSVPFPSVPYPSVPFPSVPFPSVPYPSVPFPSVPFPSVPLPPSVSPPIPQFARNAKRNMPAAIERLKHMVALLPLRFPILSVSPSLPFPHPLRFPIPSVSPSPSPPPSRQFARRAKRNVPAAIFARKAKCNVPAAIDQLKHMAALLLLSHLPPFLSSLPPSTRSPPPSFALLQFACKAKRNVPAAIEQLKHMAVLFARKAKRNVPEALQQLKRMAALLPPLPPAPFFPFPSSPAPPLPPSASSSPSSQLSTSTAETGLGHREQEGGVGGGGGGQVGGAVAGEGGGAVFGGGADAGQEGRGTAEGGAVQERRVAAGDEAVQESSLPQGIADADAAWRSDALRALKEDDEGDERDEGDEGDEEYEEEEESEEEIEEEEEGAERGERGMGQEERASLGWRQGEESEGKGADEGVSDEEVVVASFEAPQGSRQGEESEGKGADEGMSDEEVVVASDAAFLLAVMAATGFAGEVYPRNETLALHYLQLAAETGSMQAMAALASRFLYGRGVPTDCEASLAYYRSTAADLSAAAEASGDQQLPRDPVRLRDWFRDGGFQPQAFDDDHAEQVEFEQDLAERGVPESLRLMGFRHLIGQGIPRNPQEALRHFRLAAAAGDDVAAFNLGYMHMTGAGGAVPKNFTAARKYFLQAASGRNKLAAAQNGMGVLYQNGWGVKQDLNLAREFFLKAAERNDSDALSNLGYIHFDGLGVPANATTAVGYFERAMDAGQWSAPYTLARILDGSLVSASTAYSAADGAADSAAATVPRNCSRAAKLYGIFVSERIGWAAELKEAAAAYEDGDWWSGLVRYGMVAEEGSKVAAENAAQMLMRGQGYSASDRYAVALDHVTRAVHIGSAPAMVDAALLMLIHHLPSLAPLPSPPPLSAVDPHLSTQSIPALDPHHPAQSLPAVDPHHPAQSLPAVDQNSTEAQPVTGAADPLPCDPLSLLQRAADLHEPEALFHLAYLHISNGTLSPSHLPFPWIVSSVAVIPPPSLAWQIPFQALDGLSSLLAIYYTPLCLNLSGSLLFFLTLRGMHYYVPLCLNLSGLVLFFLTLRGVHISVAVPYYVPLCLNLSGLVLFPHPEGRARLCGSAMPVNNPQFPPQFNYHFIPQLNPPSPTVLRAAVPQPLGFGPFFLTPRGVHVSVAGPVSNLCSLPPSVPLFNIPTSAHPPPSSLLPPSRYYVPLCLNLSVLRAAVPQPLGFGPFFLTLRGVHVSVAGPYYVPLCLNLSGSVLFFLTLRGVHVSVAVPVSNGATFAFNAAAGYAFGEKIQPALALGVDTARVAVSSSGAAYRGAGRAPQLPPRISPCILPSPLPPPQWIPRMSPCPVAGLPIEELDEHLNFRRGYSLGFVDDAEDKTHILPVLRAVLDPAMHAR
ncbi:unnamed protein product, partial [Closterium sp. Naga37s-1]